MDMLKKKKQLGLNDKLGYPCINLDLKQKGVRVNRQIKKARFLKEGLGLCSSLALQNIQDLKTVLEWNLTNEIYFYRMSSSMIPWHSEYKINQLPDYTEIKNLLSEIGDFAKTNNIRLTFHPGPFNILASDNKDVVRKSIIDIDNHAEIMDLMGLESNPWAKINIHLGTTKGGKQEVYQRFNESFKLLSSGSKNRLTIENDDKASMYSVVDLEKNIHQVSGCPIVFDVHHHYFNNSGLDESQAATLAKSTWPTDIDPVFHYSASILYEKNNGLERAHADWIYDTIRDHKTNAWYMCECKMKEKAIKDYLENGPRQSMLLEKFQPKI